LKLLKEGSDPTLQRHAQSNVGEARDRDSRLIEQ
jgi:hypothetical protein